MTNIISCSIPNDLAQFLEENQDISPSKVLQERLYFIKEEQYKLSSKLKVMEIRNLALVKRLSQITDYLQQKNIVIPENVLD